MVAPLGPAGGQPGSPGAIGRLVPNGGSGERQARRAGRRCAADCANRARGARARRVLGRIGPWRSHWPRWMRRCRAQVGNSSATGRVESFCFSVKGRIAATTKRTPLPSTMFLQSPWLFTRCSASPTLGSGWDVIEVRDLGQQRGLGAGRTAGGGRGHALAVPWHAPPSSRAQVDVRYGHTLFPYTTRR